MVVGVGTGLETLHRNAPASIRAGHVWVDPKRGACRPGGSRPGCQRGAGANYEDFVGARPVKRELGLEDLGVRVRLCTLAGGGNRIVHPHPAAKDEFAVRRRGLSCGTSRETL